MPLRYFVVLIPVFLATSIISVITGSTSLITVPALFQSGVDPRVAIATNMFALTWMSIGGAAPFLRSGVLDRRRLPLLLGLTFVGSALGATLVLVVAPVALPLVVAIAMLVVTAFTLTNRTSGIHPVPARPQIAQWAGYAATFVLGIYGGFFSGGYVTLLTAAYVALFALFGMTFIEAVAITKVINVCSSAVATAIFIARGIVDYRLGLVLGVTMFIGALLGARLTLRLPNKWVRRIFVATVVLLALKTLLYDVLWTMIQAQR